MMQHLRIHSSLPQRGFTLLLAALIASIVLSLAVSIFDIAQKQVLLSSLSQQSQYAFYAADTASECALYWDVRPAIGYFSPTTPSISPTCDNPNVPLTITPPNETEPYSYPYTYSFTIDLQSGFSAAVTVQKCQGQITDGGTCCPMQGVTNGSCDSNKHISTISTQIRANGYNAPYASVGHSVNILQRSVVLNY